MSQVTQWPLEAENGSQLTDKKKTWVSVTQLQETEICQQSKGQETHYLLETPERTHS